MYSTCTSLWQINPSILAWMEISSLKMPNVMNEMEQVKRERWSFSSSFKIRYIILSQNGISHSASYLMSLKPKEVIQDENISSHFKFM